MSRVVWPWLVVLFATSCGRTDLTPDEDSETSEGLGVDTGSSGEPTGAPDGTGGIEPGVCSHGGEIVWSVVRPQENPMTVGHALTFDEREQLVVAGSWLHEDARALWVASFDRTGELAWELPMLFEGGTDFLGETPRATGVVVEDERIRFAGYGYELEPQGWFGSVLSGGEAISTKVTPRARWNDLAAFGDGTYALAGRFHGEPEEAGLARVEADGRTSWSWAGGSMGEIGAVTVFDGDVFATGSRDGELWVARFDPEGDLQWEDTVEATTSAAGTSSGRAIAVSDARILVAGSEGARKSADDGPVEFQEVFVGTWSLDGLSTWSWRRPPDSVRPGTATAITVMPDGDAIVVGEEETLGEAPGLFIVRFGAHGQPRWIVDTGQLPLVDSATGTRATDAVVDPNGHIYVLGNTGEWNTSAAVLLEVCP